MPTDSPANGVPPFRRVLAVCAHPDDESFGLGGIIGSLTSHGRSVDLVTFTTGGRSMLSPEAAEREPGELEAAADRLGIHSVRNEGFDPDSLAVSNRDRLAGIVIDAVADLGADALLTFDATGVTDHPDHKAVSRAAGSAGERLGLPVLTWVIPRRVASTLTREFAIPFHGRSEFDIDFVVAADRPTQRAAVAEHASQSASFQVVSRRIDLLGDVEWIRRAARDRSPLGRVSQGT